tara:strand:- start:337 stop:1710 length:1374 start_codon:yes stop_codon:yes gene_type:complete
MGFWSDTFGGGNSFSESVANVTTKDDNYEYRGGTLYDNTTNNPVSKDQFGSDSKYGPLGRADSSNTDAYSYNLNQGNAGTTPLNSNATSDDRGGLANGLAAITRRPSTMANLGLMAGGLPGAIMAGTIAAGSRNRYNQKNPAFPIDRTLKADPEFRKKAAAQEVSFGRLGKEGRSFTKDQLTQIREGKGRIEGAFFKDGDTSKQFKMNMFGNTYEINPETGNSKLIEDQAAAAGGEGGIAAVRPVGTQATAPTNAMPAISAMSEAAASGAFMPIPDPNYDPNDPMSSKYIINPTYDQIAEYQKSILGMARGGEVESALGGNEKDLINDAEKAIRGELDETRAAIILAQYVQQYGEGALMNLVDSVRTGEADETRAQFASGKNGMVRGNGDGSGVDDMVTAQLKDGDATQDVLLADGEFVMRKDATDSLQKAYGDDMLDKINDAGPNAAAALKKYLTG